MERRYFLIAMAACATSITTRAAVPKTAIHIYKVTGCECCEGWAEHLRRAGFAVSITEVGDTAPYRAKAGIPERLGSCHTAFVDGYAIEGHVPAEDINRLLAKRPAAKGLTAPGMPATSPGMDQPHGPAWDVLLVAADDSTHVYHHFPAR